MKELVLERVAKRLKKEEKGFTLIELLAVIVILGIIAAIAVPLIGKIINKSGQDSDIATARQVYDAARLYMTSENISADGTNPLTIQVIKGTGTEATKGLQVEGYLDNNLILPSTKAKVDGGEVVFTKDGDLNYVHIDAGNVAGTDDFFVSAADVIAGKGDKYKTAAALTP
jgi:type IV pilus assembly protein PilA